jgi:type II secretory pathway component PulK
VKRPARKGKSGSVALILVIVTIALITALVIEITFRSQVTASVVVNRRDNAKGYELARAAMNWSAFRLALDSTLDKIPVIPGTNYGGKKDDLTEVQWAFPITYPFPIGAPDPAAPADVGLKPASDIGGSFVSVLSDESSKINLNDVGSGGPQGNAKWSGAAIVLENLLLSPRFKRHFKGRDHREILWAVDDWVDADSEVNHTGGGIEDVDYRIEGTRYHVKNAPLFTVSELHRLKPMNDDLFRELAPFVTVYPFDARLPRFNLQPVNPLGRINVNTAPMELIAALFSRSVMPDWRERLDCAQKVVKGRSAVVFRSARKGGAEPNFVGFLEKACRVRDEGDETRALIGQDVAQILEVSSEVFSTEATGITGNTEKTIRAVIHRKDPAKPQILYWKVI